MLFNSDKSVTIFPLEEYHIGQVPTQLMESDGGFEIDDSCAMQNDSTLIFCDSKNNVR